MPGPVLETGERSAIPMWVRGGLQPGAGPRSIPVRATKGAFVSADTGNVTMCGYDHSTRAMGLSDHAAMVATLDYTPGAQPTEAGVSR